MIEKVVPVDCAQFEKILHDLDRPGTVGFALRDSAFAHAESCNGCGRLLTQAESLDLALRAISAPDSERKASPRVETALMEEFRKTRTGSSRLKVKWQIAALGAAAVALLALGLSLHRFSPSPKAPVALQGSGNSAVGEDVSAPSATLDARNNEENEVESGDPAAFIPLPYADDPQGLEGGAIVRVELSGNALASLGMPVTFAAFSSTVPADLLVSQDGTPQAIRLISQAGVDQEF